MNECTSNPAGPDNNPQCEVPANSFRCTCHPEYKEPCSEILVNVAGLCQNGSQCSDLSREFTCHSLTAKNHFCHETFGFVIKKGLKNVKAAYLKKIYIF